MNEDKGYCPIPHPDAIKDYIYWIQRMWLGDNCHTFDRKVFKA